jgi:hypothetical protein
MEPEMSEPFNVIIFFPDETWIYEAQGIEERAAAELAIECTGRPAAKLGFIAKVMVTDMLDRCCFEWQNGKGIIFPTREDIEASRESSQTKAP